MPILFAVFACLVLCCANPAYAGREAFHSGTVIPEFGKIATVDHAQPLPKNTEFRVRFDIGGAASPGKIHRQIESVARFINMHAEAGVPRDKLHLAVVLHGGVAKEMTKPERYEQFDDLAQIEHINAALITALVEQGVIFTVCGQTAAYYDISADDLLPGVTLSLSAMTAHALLAQEGYSLNPF